MNKMKPKLRLIAYYELYKIILDIDICKTVYVFVCFGFLLLLLLLLLLLFFFFFFFFFVFLLLFFLV